MVIDSFPSSDIDNINVALETYEHYHNEEVDDDEDD